MTTLPTDAEQIVRLVAEVKRLREALQEIKDGCALPRTRAARALAGEEGK